MNVGCRVQDEGGKHSPLPSTGDREGKKKKKRWKKNQMWNEVRLEVRPSPLVCDSLQCDAFCFVLFCSKESRTLDSLEHENDTHFHTVTS